MINRVDKNRNGSIDLEVKPLKNIKKHSTYSQAAINQFNKLTNLYPMHYAAIHWIREFPNFEK